MLNNDIANVAFNGGQDAVLRHAQVTKPAFVKGGQEWSGDPVVDSP